MRFHSLFGLDTLRGTLRLYTVLLVLLPVTLAATFFSLFERERLLRQELNQLIVTLVHDRAVMQSWLEARLGDVRFMASLDAARRGDLPLLERIFANYTQSHRYVDTVAFVDTKDVTAADPKHPGGIYLGDREYVREAREGRAVISGVLVNRASGTPQCLVAAPVTDMQEQFGGIIFTAVEMASLDQLLIETSPDGRNSLLLTDEAGRILAPVQSLPTDPEQWPRVSAALLQLGEDGGIYSDADGREMLGAAVTLPMRGWRLIRQTPTAAVLAGYRRQALWVGVGIVATVLLVTPLLLRLCRNLECSLETLARYARDLRLKGYEQRAIPLGAASMPLEIRDLYAAFHAMAHDVRGHIEQVERLSIQDHLTGVYNRRFLYDGGTKMLLAFLRAARPCSCLMLDVDHFKVVNDTYGHRIGDQILAHLAGVLMSVVRSADLVARYGGEEFVILATGADKGQGAELAERIRQALAHNPCQVDGRTLPVTVCIGVAAVRQEVQYGEGVLDDLLARADRAMYQAKTAGRDRVVVEA